MPFDDNKSRTTEATEGSLHNASADSAGRSTDAERRERKQRSRHRRVHEDAHRRGSNGSGSTPDDRDGEKDSRPDNVSLAASSQATSADVQSRAGHGKAAKKMGSRAARLDDDGCGLRSDGESSETKEEEDERKLPGTTDYQHSIGKKIPKKVEEVGVQRRAGDVEYRETKAKAKAKSMGPELSPASSEPVPPGMLGAPSKGGDSGKRVGNNNSDIAAIEESPHDRVDAPDRGGAVTSNVRPGAFAVGGISSTRRDVESGLASSFDPTVRDGAADYDIRIKATIVKEPETVEATPINSGGRVTGCAMALVILSMLLNMGAQSMVAWELAGMYGTYSGIAGAPLLGIATFLCCILPCANKDETVPKKRVKRAILFHIAACILYAIATKITLDEQVYQDQYCFSAHSGLYFDCMRAVRANTRSKGNFACHILAWLAMAAALSCSIFLLCRTDGQRRCCNGIQDKVFFCVITALIFFPVIIVISFAISQFLYWKSSSPSSPINLNDLVDGKTFCSIDTIVESEDVVWKANSDTLRIYHDTIVDALRVISLTGAQRNKTGTLIPDSGEGEGNITSTDINGDEIVPTITSTDIFGETIAVGIGNADSNLLGAGSVHLFSFFGIGLGGWHQTGTITDGTSYSHFGSSVSLRDDVLAVGAEREDNNRTDSGEVFIYARSGSAWNLETRLRPSPEKTRSLFGHSLVLRKASLVVAAPGERSVYVFSRDGSAWNQSAKLIGPNMDLDFGSSVAMNEDEGIIVVGASYPYTDSYRNAAVYAYLLQGSKWKQFVIEHGEDDRLGLSVAIHNQTIIIGGSKSVSVYMYGRDRKVWTKVANVREHDADIFGFTLNDRWAGISYGNTDGARSVSVLRFCATQ